MQFSVPGGHLPSYGPKTDSNKWGPQGSPRIPQEYPGYLQMHPRIPLGLPGGTPVSPQLEFRNQN